MGEFNTVGLEDIIDAFGRRETATVEAVPKMLKAGADVLIEAQKAEAQAFEDEDFREVEEAAEEAAEETDAE